MTKNKFTKFALGTFLVLGGLNGNASEMLFSYTYGDTDYIKVGTKKAETYDVAIRLSDPSLVGSKIKTFNVPMVDSEEPYTISNVSVWVSKELTLENKVNIPDIFSIDAEIVNNEINLTFPELIEIPEGGVYVGYTFTVDKKGGAADQPIFVAGEPNEDGLFLHTSRTYLKWKSQSDNFGHSSAITVGIDGDFYADALGLTNIEKPYAVRGEESSLNATITNHGSEPLKSFEYSISFGSETQENIITFEEPINLYFGQSFNSKLNYIAPEEKGDYNISVEITKVNGQENKDLVNKTEETLEVFNYLPVHKPLMEEYTGLWCGWCPRGFAALEAMNSLYPKEFVGISYHNGDDMERISSSSYPNHVSGFPAAYMDRVSSIDAYFGTDNSGFGIQPYWKSIQETFTPAVVNGFATENEDGSISVKSEIIFIKSVPGSYKVAYAIIANGLTNGAWGQSNNYSGNNPNDFIPEMDKFCTSPSVVYGLVFDDIFAAGSNLRGESSSTINNIIPDEVYSNEYSFSPEDGISLRKYDLFSNAKSLDAVIILLDEEGAVVNSNKVAVENHNSGIESILDDGNIINIEYFDISGRKISDPSRGVFIKVETTDGGVKKTSKIIK